MPESSPLVPPGSPAPTGKTLSEIQPAIPLTQDTASGSGGYVHVISTNRPGHYYLTRDVVVPAGMNGVQVQFRGDRPGVTLDLNGFAIRGDVNVQSGIAISLVSAHRHMIIKNGIVEGFETGVHGGPAPFVTAVSRRFENLVVRRCSLDGIFCQGGLNIIRNCRADSNGRYGFAVSHGIVELSTATGNGSHGFTLFGGVQARYCLASRNGARGFWLYSYMALGNAVSDCHASDNTEQGFHLDVGSVAERCLATRNTSGGFLASASRLTGNLARRNGPDGNGTAAGILVSDSCVVEDNYCVGNERGIVATGARNLIQRNACSGNGTNWVIGAGNTANVIVAAKSPASSEAPNGVPLGSSDPLVNYTF